MKNIINFMGKDFYENERGKVDDVIITFYEFKDTRLSLILESPNFKKCFLHFVCYSNTEWNFKIGEMIDWTQENPSQFWIDYAIMCDESEQVSLFEFLDIDYVKGYFNKDYDTIIAIVEECVDCFAKILDNKNDNVV